MVEINFVKGPYGFEVMKLTGHAEYNPGNDVVCAGVSALSQALIGTLQNMKVIFQTKIIESGNILIEILPFSDNGVQKIIDTVFLTCLIGLLQIQQTYPGYLKVTVS
jgi:uncharacterized protein YsxB (DUF464 family)